VAKTDIHINTAIMEFRFRLRAEFDSLLSHYAFMQMVIERWGNLDQLATSKTGIGMVYCFDNAIEGLAMALSRLWDSETGATSLSLPALVKNYDHEEFLGFRCLGEGGRGRDMYDRLSVSSTIKNLRIVRTEALAHMVVVGQSRDRGKIGELGQRNFDVTNVEMMSVAEETLILLKLMFDDQILSSWDKSMTIEDHILEGCSRLRAFFDTVQ